MAYTSGNSLHLLHSLPAKRDVFNESIFPLSPSPHLRLAPPMCLEFLCPTFRLSKGIWWEDEGCGGLRERRKMVDNLWMDIWCLACIIKAFCVCGRCCVYVFCSIYDTIGVAINLSWLRLRNSRWQVSDASGLKRRWRAAMRYHTSDVTVVLLCKRVQSFIVSHHSDIRSSDISSINTHLYQKPCMLLL
jgi:hypothetical protein